MKNINKDNLENFMVYYQNFHDSTITSIDYDILNSKMTLYINVFWSGDTTTNKDGSLNTHKSRIKILFEDVYKCNNKELFLWDSIYDAYLKYIHLDNQEYLCFADDEKTPSIYIVCKIMKYEVL